MIERLDVPNYGVQEEIDGNTVTILTGNESTELDIINKLNEIIDHINNQKGV